MVGLAIMTVAGCSRSKADITEQPLLPIAVEFTTDKSVYRPGKRSSSR